MADSELNMTLRTVREGANVTDDALNELKDFDKGLTNVEKTVAGTRTTIGKLDQNMNVFGKNIGSATELMSGLGMSIPISPMQLFGTALNLASQAASESLNVYADYIDQIDKMAAYTSTNSEEMSKLYQISDDLRIPVNDLEMALKSMADKGTTPSIEGIQALSERYLSIQDPLQRAQFLTENFGRAGQEMARLMEMGAAGIETAAESVDDFLIVSGRTREEMKAFREAQDRWNDAILRIKFSIGDVLMPIMTELLGALTVSKSEWDEFFDSLGSGWERIGNIILALQGKLPPVTAEIEAQNEALVKNSEYWGGMASAASNYASGGRGNLSDREGYGSIYGGGRAGGGPVFPGFEYDVGEREKETFVPTTPGFIVPNSNGGGGPTIIIQYSSAISLANMEEAEQVLVPMIRQALRSV